MSTDIVRRVSPEEEELAQKRKKLALLQAELAELGGLTQGLAVDNLSDPTGGREQTLRLTLRLAGRIHNDTMHSQNRLGCGPACPLWLNRKPVSGKFSRYSPVPRTGQ